MKSSAVVKISDHPKHKRTKPVRPVSFQTRREEAWADALFASIVQAFNDVEFFTREDCLYLPVVQHIAKITAYREICTGLDRLKRQRRIDEVTRTELVIAGRKRRVNMEPLADQYGHTIVHLMHAYADANPGESFGVMHVVERWTTDPHLTTNAKRVAVRQMLRRLAREEVLIRQPDHTFTRIAKD